MSKLTEREWWAILVDAESGAVDGSMACHNLANRARQALVKEFGLNLDTVWDRIRPEFLRLYEEEEAKIEAEKVQREQAAELLAKLKQ